MLGASEGKCNSSGEECRKEGCRGTRCCVHPGPGAKTEVDPAGHWAGNEVNGFQASDGWDGWPSRAEDRSQVDSGRLLVLG